MPVIRAPTKPANRQAKARLQSELASSRVTLMGDYAYVTHPVLDGIPSVEPGYVSNLATTLVEALAPEGTAPTDVAGVITVEAMGIPVAFMAAGAMHLPLLIARKKEYKIPGEIVVRRRTAYSETNLSFNGLEEGRSYWFIDTLLSTGATLKSSMLALKLANAKVAGAAFLVSKMNEDQAQQLADLTGIEIKSLLALATLKVENGEGGAGHGYDVRVSDGFVVRARPR